MQQAQSITLDHTVTVNQLSPNDAGGLSYNTTPRKDGASNQNNDSGELNTDIGTQWISMTQNNNTNSVSRRASNHSTKDELEVPYVSNVDHKTITTEETSTIMNSEIGNQMTNMNQNTISSVSQNTHIMLSTQAQQVNNENHVIPHLTFSNKGNRMMENNKHNHNTAIYNSNRVNTTGIQAYPTAQPPGSTDNNIHRGYSENSYYNIRQYSDDNSIEDMTITADMIIKSISHASNDNTQCHYTQSLYIPGFNMSYTGTGASELV